MGEVEKKLVGENEIFPLVVRKTALPRDRLLVLIKVSQSESRLRQLSRRQTEEAPIEFPSFRN